VATTAAAGQDLYQQSVTNLLQSLSCPFCISSYVFSISRCHFFCFDFGYLRQHSAQ